MEPGRTDRGAALLLVALAAAMASGGASAAEAPAVGAPGPAAVAAGAYCAGEYADDLAALSLEARSFELAQPQYTLCIRTSAVYECPFYDADGNLRRMRRRVRAHGTGFVIRRDGSDSLVVTNQHVAEWPAVTDAEHAVDGVPAGCKRVSDALRIVDGEADTYERDDVPLTRVVVDPQLDVAVLRAKAALPVLPWKIGHSAALRERNAVDVRGFPLGVLRTTNVGKVTSAYEHDRERDWDHDDFVVDALLSAGNSGSPVFAVSCRTHELELVGIYHAGYDDSALNVVIGIDQVRPLLDTLRRAPRRASAADVRDAEARRRIASALAQGVAPYFPFGPTTAAVRARGDGALVFELLPRQFPVRTQPVLVLEDLPPTAPGDFGRLGRIWAGDGRRVRLVDRAELDSESQAGVARLLDALRSDADTAARLRAAESSAASSREQFDEAGRRETAVARLPATRAEVAQAALDLADRLGGSDQELGGTLADALAVPPSPAPPGASPPGTAGAAGVPATAVVVPAAVVPAAGSVGATGTKAPGAAAAAR